MKSVFDFLSGALGNSSHLPLLCRGPFMSDSGKGGWKDPGGLEVDGCVYVHLCTCMDVDGCVCPPFRLVKELKEFISESFVVHPMSV